MGYSVRLEGFEGLEEEWQQILSSCVTNTIFLTPGWQRTWWREFGHEADLCLLSLREGEILRGIAPLVLKDGLFSFIGDTDLVDYHDFLVPRGTEEVFYNTLLDYLEPVGWHTLDLRSLPQGSPTLEYMPALAKERGYWAEVNEEDIALGTPLPNSWDSYLAGLTKKDRHELRRKMRRLEGAGVICQYACSNPQTLSGCMDEFFRLLRASSPDKEEFLTPEREGFFRSVAIDLAYQDEVKLYFLELDGVRVASAMCFDYQDSLLLYNSGYDPAYASLSVGLLNKALCVKEAIEEGKHYFDFLRGHEPYKYDLGGRDHVLYHLVIRREEQ